MMPPKRSTLGYRSSLEWCRMWGITINDPIGWTRDDGIDMEHLIRYDDFYERMMDSQCKFYGDRVPDSETEI
jgi:hypothetical protein